MSTPRKHRTAWWGTCENEDCVASMVIYPHPDAIDDLPDQDDWDDSFVDCPVCGDGMDWGGTDHPADILRSYR